MFRLKLLGRSLCFIQAYGPNSSVLYPKFVKEITEVPRRVKTNESTILLGNFNAEVGNNARVWRVVICDTVILTLMITEESFCNCAASTLCES